MSGWALTITILKEKEWRDDDYCHLFSYFLAADEQWIFRTMNWESFCQIES